LRPSIVIRRVESVIWTSSVGSTLEETNLVISDVGRIVGAPRLGRGRTSLEPRQGAGNDRDSGRGGVGSCAGGSIELALEERALPELKDDRGVSEKLNIALAQ
jgi:hypothetical protein